MKQTHSLDIKAFLDQDQNKDLLRILTAGSVDDGKSTLIGRLLFDSKRLYEDHLQALERDSKRIGHAGDDIDYALLLDGLKAEREQGITIDVAYRYFSTNKRKFIIADTPGHEQYTRNMVTGASTANLAIILIDARKGVITQTRRHTFIVSLLGIKHVVLAVNKMDLMDYSQEVFDNICNDYRNFITGLDIPDINFIPLSALKGDNVVDITDRMPWYHGKSLLEFLETVHVGSDRNFSDLRFPVQYVNRPTLTFRGFAGRITSGIVRKGDTVMALPSRQTSTVESIVTYNGEPQMAFPPQSVTLTLADEIDISRGEMLVHPDNMPLIGRHQEAMLVWMDEKPLDVATQYYIKHTTSTTRVRIDAVRYKMDVNTLEKSPATQLTLNEIARVAITTAKPLFFDSYKKNHGTGSFVLIDPVTNNTSAVGMIIDARKPDELSLRITDAEIEKIEHGECLITSQERERFYNQCGATIWITGLHGSGKNRLAYTVERRLFDEGATVVLLEGNTIRAGLSRELDHSPADRAEHLRRVAHVARLLNDQGIITLCSFISPDDNIRRQVAQIIGQERFHLVYMDADVDFGRENRPKLWERADRGEIENMPGLDANYDIPENAHLVVDPRDDENVERIMTYLRQKKIFPLK
ncbi:MAG: sulfate adenylyltransferase subunit CysN [Bacteroidales bacterium]|nr:sulfate adenylyltransferase subunit CysN [Bacteroidales bacterium]MDD3131435.1 sulfate adenylyltransferase subunit CysN [Bacteroidales bacterium]